MGDPRRPEKVGEAIREQVATFLSEGVKDPRVRGLVTVTAVDMTRDLRHANVFVSIMGSDEDRSTTMEGLSSVASHMRSVLGKTLRLRNAPEIHFKFDESVARASRIEELLAQVRNEREQNQGSSSEGPGDSVEPAVNDAAHSDNTRSSQ